MNSEALTGENARFLDELYEQYKSGKPVASQWQAIFKSLDSDLDDTADSNLSSSLSNDLTSFNNSASPASTAESNASANLQATMTAATEPSAASDAPSIDQAAEFLNLQSNVQRLIQGYRNFGHTQAKLDPLGRDHGPKTSLSLSTFALSDKDLDTQFSTGNLSAPPIQTLRQIVQRLEQTYCCSVGAEFMFLRNDAQRHWLRGIMEVTQNKPLFSREDKLRILKKITHAEMFERFLHTKFVGQKRFSLEGAEATIVVLDRLTVDAADTGVKNLVIGMPHRGRLSALVNIFQKRPAQIFAEYKDSFDSEEAHGDVKYHLGYSSDVNGSNGNSIHLSLAFNPSHLEAVNPVVEGYVRAKQDRSGDTSGSESIPVLMHGDAAFAGQGTVMETLNLSQLNGYKTGGTIHIIVNNQIGFTTSPHNSRSSTYASDAAKMINMPVLHVNADDPEACCHAISMALMFRQTFRSDIMVDLYGYRRLGHNEMDEPSFTQPLLYEKIRRHPTTAKIYADKLIAEGSVTSEEVSAIKEEYRSFLSSELEDASSGKLDTDLSSMGGSWSGLKKNGSGTKTHTNVELSTLREIAEKASTIPEDFKAHRKVAQLYEQRLRMAKGEAALDWGMGEILAYGSLLYEKYNVRLSGQDTRRGTFSHRHIRLVSTEDGSSYYPLEHIAKDQGTLMAFDSPLSEAGVLGFDFGYSLNDPHCLTIWEAQFGDFANGAQMIIDQFVAASEAKWQRMSGLVMYLPHGYEGQGPEHSSARLERYLQMAGDDNYQVAYPTLPHQMFHLLRRQLHREYRKPLIIMTPKSLLRLNDAQSSLEDFAQNSFSEVLYDAAQVKRAKRLVFCTGKIYYELKKKLTELNDSSVALIRLEQLYPFPAEEVSKVITMASAAGEYCWAQEEPANMGSWTFIAPRLLRLLNPSAKLVYAGRASSASPATGSHKVHVAQQIDVIDKALGIKLEPSIKIAAN